MTRAKEIMKEADKVASANTQTIGDWGEHYMGFIHGVEWADEHPHWISVEDELPKGGFAIITNSEDVLVGKYNFEKGLWGVRNKTMFAYTLLPANWKVTHWMPLPQPPKKGGEE